MYCDFTIHDDLRKYPTVSRIWTKTQIVEFCDLGKINCLVFESSRLAAGHVYLMCSPSSGQGEIAGYQQPYPAAHQKFTYHRITTRPPAGMPGKFSPLGLTTGG